jgi:hypothetical protein
MGRKETRRVHYPCERLGGIAVVVLEDIYHDDVPYFYNFDCEDFQECGVGEQNSRGDWTRNWKICPAFDIRKTM